MTFITKNKTRIFQAFVKNSFDSSDDEKFDSKFLASYRDDDSNLKEFSAVQLDNRSNLWKDDFELNNVFVVFLTNQVIKRSRAKNQRRVKRMIIDYLLNV